MKPRLNEYEYVIAFTHAYQETEGCSIAQREARCLEVAAHYLYLPPQPGDRLCGRLAIAPIGFSSEPLLARSVGFYFDSTRLADMVRSSAYTAEQQTELSQIQLFWQQQETRRQVREQFPLYMQQALPQDIYWEHSEAAFPLYRMVGICLDYKKLLHLGLPGLMEEVQAKGKHSTNQALFEGMHSALKTLCQVCLCYAQDALELGEFPLADALVAITQRPPQTLLEATQLAWLYSLAAGALNYGRMDV